MQRIFWILAFLLTSTTTVVFYDECNGQHVEKEISNSAQIESRPTLLDITVTEQGTMENMNGCFVSSHYPVLGLGFPHWNDNYRGVSGYAVLSDALDTYNMMIRKQQEETLNNKLRMMAKHLAGTDVEEVYSHVHAYVTRNDTQVVSFYEKKIEFNGQDATFQFIRGNNIDTRSGKNLSFTDVFSDVDALTTLLAEIIAKTTTDMPPVSQIKAILAGCIAADKEDGPLSFALGYGGVHIFAQKKALNGTSGMVQLMLSYKDYPELVKTQYQTMPESWMLQLDYDRDYVLPDGTTLHMTWHMREEQEGEWSFAVNGKTYKESFYGYAPDCHVVHSGGRSFLYLRVPAGDISQTTNIYEIRKNSFSKRGQVEGAMGETLSMNPKRLLMIMNEHFYLGSVMLQPRGLYHVGDSGMPALIAADEFALVGPSLRLKRAVEVTLVGADAREPNTIPVHLDAGTLLTPYRTDMDSYVDFMAKDGRICRFTANGFTGKINLGGYGNPEDLLEANL